MDHPRGDVPGTTAAPAAAGSGGPQTQEQTSQEGRGSSGWISWVLVAASLLPALLLGEVARQVLTGGRDRSYFGTYYGAYSGDDDPATGMGVTWRMRLDVLWSAVPVLQTLLGTLPGSFALCAVTLARRPGWLVPSRAGRWVGAGAAGLVALESLLALCVLLAGSDEADDTTADGSGWLLGFSQVPRGFPEVGPVLAVLAVTTVLPLFAGFLLLRPDRSAPGEPDDTATGSAEPGPEPPPGPQNPEREPDPGRGTGPRNPPPELPRLREEDRARYRRPAS